MPVKIKGRGVGWQDYMRVSFVGKYRRRLELDFTLKPKESKQLIDIKAFNSPLPMEIEALALGTTGKLVVFKFYLYNKDGSYVKLDTPLTSFLGHFKIYGEALNGYIDKKLMFWRLAKYDDTTGKYVVEITRPIVTYGIKIVAENFEDTTHTVSMDIVYSTHALVTI